MPLGCLAAHAIQHFLDHFIQTSEISGDFMGFEGTIEEFTNVSHSCPRFELSEPVRSHKEPKRLTARWKCLVKLCPQYKYKQVRQVRQIRCAWLNCCHYKAQKFRRRLRVVCVEVAYFKHQICTHLHPMPFSSRYIEHHPFCIQRHSGETYKFVDWDGNSQFKRKPTRANKRLSHLDKISALVLWQTNSTQLHKGSRAAHQVLGCITPARLGVSQCFRLSRLHPSFHRFNETVLNVLPHVFSSLSAKWRCSQLISFPSSLSKHT